MNCKIRKCPNKVFSLGYCVKHYKRLKRNGDPLKLVNDKHGMSYSREYSSWHMMKERCLNKNLKQYKNYGGRGITICDEWISSFSAFYRDMGNRPKDTSIDRVDNNGNYCKENCKWSNSVEQNNNQRIRSTNKSGYVGVSWYKQSKKWRASITVNGKVKNLGHFNDKEKAREAYLESKQQKD